MATTLKTKGIVLKIKDTPGKDKLVYILTNEGLLKAFMTPKKMAGKKSFAVDLFAYGEVVYYVTDSGNNLVNSIVPDEFFFGIREDIARLYTAGYFANLAIHTQSDADTDSETLLELVLESFKRLSNGENIKIIKPVFELVISRLLGISPCLEAETKGREYYFSMEDGRLFINPKPNTFFVSRTVILTIYKILNSEIQFAFDAVCEQSDMLYQLCEMYIAYQTERDFEQLKFLNGVI